MDVDKVVLDLRRAMAILRSMVIYKYGFKKESEDIFKFLNRAIEGLEAKKKEYINFRPDPSIGIKRQDWRPAMFCRRMFDESCDGRVNEWRGR